MADIPKTYASPGMRWGMYLHDHPYCDQPVYEVITLEEAGYPALFHGNCQGVIRCTLKAGDGSKPSVGLKEIPVQESRRNSSKTNVANTAETWPKFKTAALGRALKAAGYPDDTEDLKALLLWKRRHVEMKAIADGIQPAPTPSPVADDDDLGASAKATPDFEHEAHGDRADEEQGDPDGEPDPVHVRWHPDLIDKVSQLGEDDVAAVLTFAREKGIDVENPDKKLKNLDAFIAARLRSQTAPATDGEVQQAPDTMVTSLVATIEELTEVNRAEAIRLIVELVGAQWPPQELTMPQLEGCEKILEELPF